MAMAVISAVVICAGCTSSSPHEHAPPQPRLSGRVTGNFYTSSDGHFSVPIPVSPEVGGRVAEDTAQSVLFRDNWGDRISFSSTVILPQSPMMSIMQTKGREAALEDLMKTIYNNLIVTHYHPDVRDGAVSFIYLKPVGPKTGVAAFVHQDRVYLVETDLMPGVQLLSKIDEQSEEARDKWLENRAVELLQTVEVK